MVTGCGIALGANPTHPTSHISPAAQPTWVHVGSPLLAQPHGGIPHVPCSCSRFLSPNGHTVLSAALFGTGVWLGTVLLFRRALRLLLTYHGWMFEPHGRLSRRTRIWMVSACGHAWDTGMRHGWGGVGREWEGMG